MHKKVFIIGNGFDLDLGWKTSYRDFVSSDYWPLKNNAANCPMAEYLKLRTEADRWYDLESMLKTYASDNRHYHDNAKTRFIFSFLKYYREIPLISKCYFLKKLPNET